MVPEPLVAGALRGARLEVCSLLALAAMRQLPFPGGGRPRVGTLVVEATLEAACETDSTERLWLLAAECGAEQVAAWDGLKLLATGAGLRVKGTKRCP